MTAPTTTPADIVFTGLGSLGDVYPLLPVVERLAERGHRCRIAAPPALALALRGAGFGVRPIGPALGMSGPRRRQSLTPDGYGAWESMVRNTAVATLGETVPDLRRQLADADLLVTTAWQLAGPIAAESAGVPWVTAHLFPWFIPSALAGPPAGYPDWPTVLDRFAAAFDPPINDARRAAGLDPRRDNVVHGNVSPLLTMVLADEWAHAPALDWPVSVRSVGYPLWEDPRPVVLDDEALAFLRADEPPVVFYLGTAVAQVPEVFWSTALAAARSCGRRAVLLTSSGTTVDAADDRVLVRKYLPLHVVLPCAALLVHCGSSAGTYGAIRYGVPSVVVPRFFDNPTYAARLEELGVGMTLPWDGLTQELLSGAIEAVLSSGRHRARAGELRASLRQPREPADTAADAVEAVLARDVEPARGRGRTEP